MLKALRYSVVPVERFKVQSWTKKLYSWFGLGYVLALKIYTVKSPNESQLLKKLTPRPFL